MDSTALILLPHLATAISGSLFLLGARPIRAKTRGKLERPGAVEPLTAACDAAAKITPGPDTSRTFCGLLCLAAVVLAGMCLLLSARQRTHFQPRPAALLSAAETVAASAGPLKSESGTDQAPPRQLPFRQDALSIGMQWLAIVMAALFTLMATSERHRSANTAETFGLLLFLLTGLMLVSVANDLIVILLSIELISIAAYLLIVLSAADPPGTFPTTAGDRPFDPATCFLLTNSVASVMLLFGFGLLYGLAGTTHLDSVRDALTGAESSPPASALLDRDHGLGVAAFVFILAATGVKFGVAPFHCCLVDAADSVRSWTAGWIIVTLQIAGFLVLLRVLSQSMPAYSQPGLVVVLVFAVGSMALGNLMAVVESRIRRLLAYAAVSQAGFLLAALAAGLGKSNQAAPMPGMPSDLPTACFFLVAYCLAIGGLFAVLVHLSRTDRQVEFVEDLSGLIQTEPLPGVLVVLLLLSLTGLPPLAGFWGRLFIITATLGVPLESAAQAHTVPDINFGLLVGATLFHVVLTTVVALRLLIVVTLDPQRGRPQPAGGPGALAAATIAGLLLVLLGLVPGPLLAFFGATFP